MNPNKVIDLAAAFIKQWEGLRLKAYSDQGGRVTIGYGHTGGIQIGDEISDEQALEYLEKDIQFALNAVSRLVVVPLTVNQTAALTSFVFNLGASNLQRSGLLRFLNMKQYSNAADQFLLWNHIGLYVSPGLTSRREAERALFLKDDNEEEI